MIIGTGVDITEIKRIAGAVEQSGFIERVFSPGETAYCQGRKERAASFAARWAAKEAVAKALGTGIGQVNWRDIEVITDSNGRPAVALTGTAAGLADRLGVTRIHISLSHSEKDAIAFVVLEGM